MALKLVAVLSDSTSKPPKLKEALAVVEVEAEEVLEAAEVVAEGVVEEDLEDEAEASAVAEDVVVEEAEEEVSSKAERQPLTKNLLALPLYPFR